MASINQIIERWERAHNLGGQWFAKRDEVERLVASIKEMRKLIERRGAQGLNMEEFDEECCTILAKLDAEE